MMLYKREHKVSNTCKHGVFGPLIAGHARYWEEVSKTVIEMQ
jgi:hypothetical protein